MTFLSKDNAGWWLGLSISCFFSLIIELNIISIIGIIILTKSLTEMIITLSQKI